MIILDIANWELGQEIQFGSINSIDDRKMALMKCVYIGW